MFHTQPKLDMIAIFLDGTQFESFSEEKGQSSVKSLLTPKDDGKAQVKIDLLDMSFSDELTAATSETRGSIPSKDAFMILNNGGETNILDTICAEGRSASDLTFKATRSLPITASRLRMFDSEILSFESNNFAENSARLAMRSHSLCTPSEFYELIYERADKFLDTQNISMVIPADEQRPKKFVKVLSKQCSIDTSHSDVPESPILTNVGHSSLLLRRGSTSGQNFRRPSFGLSLQKSTSLILDTKISIDFDKTPKMKEVSEEDELRHISEASSKSQISESFQSVPSCDTLSFSKRLQLTITANKKKSDNLVVSCDSINN